MTESKFHVMMMPPEIMEKIMYSAIFGQEGLDADVETLDSCRKVCSAWNDMMKRNKEIGMKKKVGMMVER